MSDDDLIRRGDALEICESHGAAGEAIGDEIAALPAVKVDALTALYLMRDLLPPVDLDEPIEGDVALEPVTQPDPADDPVCTDCGGTGITYQTERRCACQPAPDPAAIRETLLSLPAVYAHQINTGVREVYDPLQRFYRMEDVLSALAAHVNETPKTEHDAGNVLTPAPDAAFASGFKAGLKAAAEHWFRGVSGVRQLLPETKAQILAIPCPQPAPTAQLDAGAIREAALREAADLVNRRVDGVRVSIPCPDGKSGCLVHHFRIEDGPTAKAILALLEKPHDRA